MSLLGVWQNLTGVYPDEEDEKEKNRQEDANGIQISSGPSEQPLQDF